MRSRGNQVGGLGEEPEGDAESGDEEQGGSQEAREADTRRPEAALSTYSGPTTEGRFNDGTQYYHFA